MQAKVLSMNFKDENFMNDQLTTKAAEVTPLNTLHGSYMAIAIIDRYIIWLLFIAHCLSPNVARPF